eukprot:80769-Pyramimonas_sp.AAC.1
MVPLMAITSSLAGKAYDISIVELASFWVKSSEMVRSLQAAPTLTKITLTTGSIFEEKCSEYSGSSMVCTFVKFSQADVTASTCLVKQSSSMAASIAEMQEPIVSLNDVMDSSFWMMSVNLASYHSVRLMLWPTLPNSEALCVDIQGARHQSAQRITQRTQL